MKKSEKQLAIAVGGLLILLVGWFALGTVNDWFASRDQQLATLNKQIADKEKSVKQIQSQIKSLKDYRNRSLPAESQFAQSAYQNWLLTVVQTSRLKDPIVAWQSTTPSRTGYDRLTFNILGKGSLESATRFLYEFYRGNHLQKITALSLKPVEKSDQLSMNITIEALALNDADRKDQLNGEVSTRLADSDYKKYSDPILSRNLFAAYVAPKPPPPPVEKKPVVETKDPPPPPPFDVANFAKLTSVLVAKDGIEAWVLVQTTGKKLALHEGDTFEVGSVKGHVTRITYDAMEFTCDGQQYIQRVGKSLREAVNTEISGDLE